MVSPDAPRRTAERPGDLLLLRPALLHEVHHRVGLGHPIIERVVSQDHAGDNDDAKAIGRPDDAAIIDDDGSPRCRWDRRRDAAVARLLPWQELGTQRRHPSVKKSGQVWVPAPSQSGPMKMRVSGPLCQEVWIQDWRSAMSGRIVGGLAMFLLVAMASSLAVAQTGGSAIVGVVKDESGGALPGVTVTVDSPALIEKTKTAVTDATGRYQVLDLRIGTYAVTFTLEGFKTVRQEGIPLDAAFTATVNAVLPMGAVEEKVTVVAGAPLVDARSSVSERALKPELLNGVPVGRNVWQVAMMVPGATTSKPDVGGSESAQTPTWSFTAPKALTLRSVQTEWTSQAFRGPAASRHSTMMRASIRR